MRFFTGRLTELLLFRAVVRGRDLRADLRWLVNCNMRKFLLDWPIEHRNSLLADGWRFFLYPVTYNRRTLHIVHVWLNPGLFNLEIIGLHEASLRLNSFCSHFNWRLILRHIVWPLNRIFLCPYQMTNFSTKPFNIKEESLLALLHEDRSCHERCQQSCQGVHSIERFNHPTIAEGPALAWRQTRHTVRVDNIRCMHYGFLNQNYEH